MSIAINWAASMAVRDQAKREERARVNEALEFFLSKFPAEFVKSNKKLKAEAEEIERRVQGVEQSIRRGARPAGRKFSL